MTGSGKGALSLPQNLWLKRRLEMTQSSNTCAAVLDPVLGLSSGILSLKEARL